MRRRKARAFPRTPAFNGFTALATIAAGGLGLRNIGLSNEKAALQEALAERDGQLAEKNVQLQNALETIRHRDSMVLQRDAEMKRLRARVDSLQWDVIGASYRAKFFRRLAKKNVLEKNDLKKRLRDVR